MLRITNLFTIFALLLISNASWAYDYTLEFTEAQLQQQLAKMMPVSREQMYVTVTLSEPILDLGIGDNKIGVFSNMDITAPGGIKGTGRAKIIGQISYKKQTGEFFLYNPTVAHIEVDQVPADFHSNIKQLAQMGLNSAIKGKPIFRLSNEDAQQKMARSMLKSVDVKPGKLLITLSIAEN